MDQRLELWLDNEMRTIEESLKGFTSKLKRNMYIYMAAAVAGMVLLGVLVGAPVKTVLTLHLPIGVVIAVFIWLCYLLQMKTTSVKKIRKIYDKAFESFFTSDEDVKAFTDLTEDAGRGDITLMNINTDKYPCRVTVGENYWVIFRNFSCRIIRPGDIKSIRSETEKTRVGYNLGNSRVSQKIAIGVSMIIDYKEGTQSYAKNKSESLFLNNGKEYEQIKQLILERCSKAAELFED